MSEITPQIQAAMHNARVPLDDRGLMPLSEARALVSKATEFRKGEGEMIDGTCVLESDRSWAALLSLEDADEFVREARRLRWFFHPRGQDDTALLDRYGPTILPWLLDFIKDDGRLINIPWCVVPCLVHIGSPEVFDELWSVRTVVDGTGTEWPGPFAADNPGDADKRSGVNLTGPVPDEPDDSANRVVVDWVRANPVLGYGALTKRALDGDERARWLLLVSALHSPNEVFAYAHQALGDQAASDAFDELGVPKEFEPRCVLQAIYTFIHSRPWPVFIGTEDGDHRAYHALRMLVAREMGTDVWGVVLERLEGSAPDTFRICRYMHSAELGSGRGEVFPEFHIDGNSIDGPAGPFTFHHSMIADRDLRPDKLTAMGVPDSHFTVLVRAYLSEHPQSFWPDPDESLATLSFDGEPEIIANTDSFEHILGERDDVELGPNDYDKPWHIDPDESDMMQSLARAVVSRDPSLFTPGTPNTNWRRHAHFPPEAS